jgi:hypothetical protein
MKGDRVRASIQVRRARDEVFSVFTEELDAWWRRGLRYRMGQDSVMRLEPALDGALTEMVSIHGRVKTYEIGRVTVWDPPRRLVIAWRPVNFRSADPSTEVEVTFERAIGPRGESTEVIIEHRGWSAVRPDHPVRHGQDVPAFVRSMAHWWSDLGSSLRIHLVENEDDTSRD